MIKVSRILLAASFAIPVAFFLNAVQAEVSTKASANKPLPSLSYISRAGWTVRSVDSQEAADPATNAFDGNPATLWHTQYNGANPAPPHEIQIDMGSSRTVGGFTYLPRQDACSNGVIGQYEFYTSTDGVNWGIAASAGTFTYTGTILSCAGQGQIAPERMVTFANRVARYVRLRALSEVNNNPWTSVAELNIIDGNDTNTAAQRGQWSNVITTSVNPVGAAVLPDGKVLIWSAYDRYTFGAGVSDQTLTAIFDPASGTATERLVVETAHDMFCPGTSFLGDGRLLVTGGDSAAKSSIYNPGTATWTSGGNMNLARGYHGQTTLDDGTAFVMGGSWSGGSLGKNGEVWSNGAWRYLPNALASVTLGPDPGGAAIADRHPWVFTMGNGKVAHVGPSVAMNIFDTTVANGSTTPAGNRADDIFSQNGTAVMYDIGKILKAGGAPAYGSANATAGSYIIDISNGISTTKTGSLRLARGMHNTVVMPNGEVIVVGGMPVPVGFSDTNSIFVSEIWNPTTGAWRDAASTLVPRNYHSIALLLPDGRVLSGGGGLCGQGCSANHSDMQIYSPAYLFKADGTAATRPAITQAPTTAFHGSSINVTTTGSPTQFVMIRFAAVTHSVNTDQRRIPLTATSLGNGFFGLAIPNSGIAPPGNYMLFALDSNGVPSVAKTVLVQPPPRPTVTIAAPASGANFIAPASVLINASVTDPAQNVVRVDFYNGTTLLGQDTTAPYSFTWTSVAAGAYTLKATVVDATGYTASATTPITVTATQTFTNSATIGSATAPFNGTAFDLRCQSNEVLVGFAGKSSTVLDQTGPMCVAVNEAGDWLASPIARGLAGGAGGATYTKTCPTNQAVVGFQGRSGLGVDQVDLACQPLSSGGNVTGTISFLGAVGGSGGNINAPTYCPAPRPAAGIFGVAGTYVGTFGFSCAVPAIQPNRTPTISLSSPANNATYTAPADIVISANVVDPDNNLAKVEFFNGTTKLGEKTASPFTFNWTSVLAGSFNVRAIATDLAGLTATASAAVTVNAPAGSPARVLQSLKGTPVPQPASINSYIANRAAAIALGKAFFWDTQISSDNRIACASCHFQAGADVRFKNQSNPGMKRIGVTQFSFAPTKSGSPASGPNYKMTASDFATYVLSDPFNANSAATFSTTDVMGSQGVARRSFTSAISGQSADTCSDTTDPVFSTFRQVTDRNAPTVINAVFNHRNFQDGRANNVFNGVDSNGDRNTGAVIYRGPAATATRIALENSSLASQAMTPPVNGGEMACGGRTWPDIGRRLLKAKPLSGQAVAATDSVLASYVTNGVKGLNGDYEALIRAAFPSDLWNSATQVTVNGKSYTQAEANFSLFFGLAVQTYQSTLVSDDAPIDRYFGTYPATTPVNPAALNAEQTQGLGLFLGKGNCVSCHSGPQLTNAGTPALQAVQNGVIADRMFQGNGSTGVYDFGFYNIGLRSTSSDLGLGGIDSFGNPLSFTRQEVSGIRKDTFSLTPCAFSAQACTPVDSTTRAVVDGAFKTPSLRNISLTGPYFHDGSRATLEDVIDFYIRGGDTRIIGAGDSTGFGTNSSNLAGGLPRIELSAIEKQALIAFLKVGLTDDRVAFERAPFDHPELPLTDGHTGPDTALVLIPAVGQSGRATPLTPFVDLVASGGLGYPAIANLPPNVNTPAPQSTAINAAVSLQIVASDPEGSALTFTATGLPTGLGINATGLISGTANTAGSFSVGITVRDSANNATSVNFSWIVTTLPVTVSMSAPATVTLPASITLAASASQPGGGISKVEFYDGATLLGTATAAPYEYVWTSASVGTHSLTAKAYGTAANATATSAAVSVTVNAAGPLPVTVSLSAPASVTLPASITLSANASQPGGSIAKVEFYDGATLLNTATTSPYQYVWTAASVGTHSVTAKAFGTGNTATSNAVSIIVNAAGGGSCAFPSVAIVDNFTRANGSLGGAWIGGIGGYTISNNQAVSNGIDAYIVSSTVLGPDQEAYVKYTNLNTSASEIDVILKSATSNWYDGSLIISYMPTVQQIQVWTFDVATDWVQRSAVNVTLANGDVFGARVRSATGAVEVYRNGVIVDTTSIAGWPRQNAQGMAGIWTVGASGTTFDDFGAGTLTCTGGAGNVPPTVSMSTNAASYTAPAAVTINATAADSDGSIAKVEFFNGGTKLGEDLTAPYSFSWTGVAAGTYTLTARATDNAGAATTSAAVSIIVNAAGNLPPTVSITTNATTYTAPAAVTINAAAADSDGSIAKVEFFNGATKLGEDLTAPYTFSWTSVTAGTYSLSAKATDNAGAATTSAAVSITVNAAGNVPPTVSMSTNAASYTAPAAVTINATAADTDGSVAKVEFFNGATKLGEDLTAPYTFSWTGVAAGTYTLSAKATDNAGAATTSAAVSITVNAAGTCSFPSIAAVSDTFNRANGAIGGNWTGATSGYSITNNQLVATDGDQYLIWNQAAGPAVEASVKLTNINPAASEIDLVLKSMGTNWYYGTVLVAYLPSTSQVQVWTSANGEWTQRNNINVQLSAGDVLGGRIRPNGTVEVYRNGVLIGSTTAADWPHLNATGFGGVWVVGGAGTAFDDFKVGTLTCQ